MTTIEWPDLKSNEAHLTWKEKKIYKLKIIKTKIAIVSYTIRGSEVKILRKYGFVKSMKN